MFCTAVCLMILPAVGPTVGPDMSPRECTALSGLWARYESVEIMETGQTSLPGPSAQFIAQGLMLRSSDAAAIVAQVASSFGLLF